MLVSIQFRGATVRLCRRTTRVAQRNSADIRRKLGEIGTNWKALWSDVYSRDDAELRAQWRSLVRRQAAIIERAPSELPLSKSLARRSQQEADWYWAQRYAAS